MHSVTCGECGKINPAGKKFCSGCGAQLPEASASTSSDAHTGDGVQWGTWGRASGDFLARASLQDMRPFFGKSNLTVPRNAVGLVVAEGSIVEMVPAGQTLQAGWLQKMGNIFTGKLDRTQFYLIDLRPLSLVHGVSAVSEGMDVQKQVVVSLRLDLEDMRREAKDKAAMTSRFWNFLEREYAGTSEVSRDDVLNHVRGPVESALETMSDELTSAPKNIERELAKAIKEELADEMGFKVEVRIRTVGKTRSATLTIGNAPLPVTRPCGGCGEAIPTSKKFCPKCGAEQPPMIDPSTLCGNAECGATLVEGKKFCTKCGTPAPGPIVRIHTADGHQIQVEVALRYDGGQPKDLAELKDALASILMRLVRDQEYDDLVSSENWRAVSDEVTRELAQVAATLGIQNLQADLMDMTSKTGEWLLNAKAEMLQEQAQLEQDREWAKLDRDKMEVQKLAFDLAIDNMRLRQNHDLNQHKLGLDQAFEKDSADIADLQRRQAHADAAADMTVADAQRDARTNVAVDAAERELNRTVSGEDHTDALTDAERAQALKSQTDGFDRTNEAADLQHKNSMESVKLQHELQTETAAATHTAELRQLSAQSDADVARTGAQADADVARTRAQAEADALTVTGSAKADLDERRQSFDVDIDERKQNLDLDRQAKEQDIALSGESQRHEMAMDAETRRAQLKMEQMRQMAESDRLMTEADAAADVAKTQASSAAEAAKLEQLKGQSVEQILAMQGGDAATGMAAALADKYKSEAAAGASGKTEELYKQMLEMQQQSASSGKQDMKEMMAMMMQMQQNASADKAASAAEGKQDMKDMMAMMMQSQQQAGAAQKAADQATVDAYKSAADQAKSMSEASMGSMAQVAAEKARTAATKEVHKEVRTGPAAAQAKSAAPPSSIACPACGASLAPDEKFCGECGHRM